MEVRLDDVKHELNCFQTIEYTNNAPVSLTELYIHLWPNAYKDESTPMAKSYLLDGIPVMLKLKEDQAGFIDSLEFRVNGESVEWKLLEDSIDICHIKLNKALGQGESLLLSTPFRVKIPSAKLSRLGRIGQAYYITQWFPKPAVYDQDGWNYFSYLDKGEYYGEYGSFDVTITLPENYTIASSGLLQDNEEEMERLNEKAKVTARIDSFSTDMSFPPSSKTLKTLRFRQDNIHDFAWFADKRYHVLKNVIPIPGEGRSVTSWAFFTNAEAELWRKVPGYMHDAVRYFSEWIGPYPYSQISAADVTTASGDGMEYPLITAIGTYGSNFKLEEVIVHEVAHNWFYGIIGTNERRHPWMDEGLTNFYETRYIYTKYSADSSLQEEKFNKLGKSTGIFKLNKINHRDSQYLSYLMGARKNTDQSPGLSSEKFSRINYPVAVYRKATMAFDHLFAYLGDSLFDHCIRHFYENWKYKHPQPTDLKNEIEKCSGKDLDWLFEDLLNSTRKIDYKIITATKRNQEAFHLIRIKNKNDLSIPFPVQAMKEDQVLSTVWLEGFSGIKETEISCGDCDHFRIDAEGRMPELYRNNNSIRTQGILRKTEKLRFRFGGALENPDRSQVFYAPAAGWNYYNGFMAGLAIHNVFIPEKKFEYAFMPLYAFNTQTIAGGGDLRYHFYPEGGIFRKITLKTGFSHYAYGYTDYTNLSGDFRYSSDLFYTKSDNRIILNIREAEPRKRIRQQLHLRYVLIKKDLIYDSYLQKAPKREDPYLQIEFLRENLNPLKTSSFRTQVTGNEDFYKLSLETKKFLHYNSVKKGFRLRFYAAYLNRSKVNEPGVDYRLRSSGYGGGMSDKFDYTDDPLFDEVFLGRSKNTGILAQQFSRQEGGLTVPTFSYRLGEDWIGGLQMSTTLPGLLPFRLYAGLCAISPGSEAISYEAGIELPLLKDIFVIYFPMLWSDDIDYILESEDISYEKLIRFELNLNKLNPLELIRKIDF